MLSQPSLKEEERDMSTQTVFLRNSSIQVVESD